MILGVHTHLDVHVAVAVDHLGRRWGESSVPTTVKGYVEAPHLGGEFWSREVRRGRRHQSSYGAGLARYLRSRGDRGARGGAPGA